MRVKQKEAGNIIICPACGHWHVLDARWTFNGNMDNPTFTPSLMCKTGKYVNPNYDGEGDSSVCHSHITDGNISFCSDSTHPYAGQTLPLPHFPNT